MAFAAITILMDTLHQHFLQPTPRFPLRNRAKVKSLYKNLSSLQTSLEKDFKVGERDEAIEALEAQMRDASVELRFQIEHQLTLFYLGKSMKLRLESAKKLLPILNRAIEELDMESMDFGCMLDILRKHFTRPVSRMPAHIKKMVKSFCTHHPDFLYAGRDDEQENDDEWEIEEEQKSDGDEWEIEEEQKSDGEQESDDEWETEDEQKRDDEERRNMLLLCEEAEGIIRQELRAPSSYLNQYMNQRIQARHRIRQIFTLGIKLTSYIRKEMLKVKNAYHQSKISPPINNNTASLRVPESNNVTVGDSLQHTLESTTTISMVGCDDEFKTIMDNLNQQSKKREIVSIVGMGGIGKTTLARRIYGDDSFISRFDCRAWVTISQQYNQTKVFKALLHSLAQGVYVENNELVEQAYKSLKGKRYLIVIDDIWSTDVWDYLMRCFQDDNNGSRMLLTTRLKNVAEYASSGSNFCHFMRFLDVYESWNLFHNKVLPGRITWSPKFERIGREIVEKCKGLPLAISVVAGLLSNSKQDLDEWELIAKNVHTLSLDQQCENIIGLSYTFLPHHLKHCFLSLGLLLCNRELTFLGDRELSGDFIVDFWVSEGFLKVLRSKSLEDVAWECLQDLVDRNLLSFREMNGGLSNEYQMHDVLRELAFREAQKENLLRFKNNFRLSLGFRRFIQPINSSSWSIQSRICSYNSLSHACNTFLCFKSSIRCRYTKQFHFHFKFLRGLMMINEPEDGNATGYMFTEFMGLVHLRYLLVTDIFKLNSLPWFMLWNLQTLQVSVDSIDEPLNIWGLPQLKNLIIQVKGGITLVPPRSVHHNLESIRFLDYRSCTKELFMRIPNLRTLAIVEGGTINLKCKASSWFESLAYLYKLEDLQVCGKLFHPKFSTIRSMETLKIEFFLPNLKKLKLLNTKLNWEDMFVVGMLSKLEVLIIARNGVVGRKWEPKDGGFHGLRFLVIFDCELKYWKVTSGLFPVLECLVLESMYYLKKIPSGFADIVTLKSIKLYECSKSIISSAKRIQEVQQEYGNNTFAVDILRNDEFDDYFWVYDQ